ncbi:hypothetical protein SAMN04487981_101511 [Streptomyces sp. cf386]|uniref:hypothetical protein n=1 Tax=Streptomyces sp. cf386 TaxID=1761904 RepID=UPI000882A4B3|nr:hypothetical protein [Streptomyces sp. cf386]SDM43699.1 hypothetical protein SAMN04487981_101511 [Streptomyces sp. cf386]
MAVMATEADLAYLTQVIEALNQLDENLYYQASDVMGQVRDLIATMANDVELQSQKLLDPENGWTGEGARAFRVVIEGLRDFLRELVEIIKKWPDPIRQAGEDIAFARFEIGTILTARSFSSVTGIDL